MRAGSPMLVLAHVLPAALGAQVPGNGPERLLIPRAGSPVVLDGRADEAAWAESVSLPVVMMLPEFGAEPSERTEFRLLHDGAYLYFACSAFDREPGALRVASLRRDELGWNSDRCMIYLDPLDDEENSLGFVTTPAGVRFDVAHSEGGTAWNADWNAHWDVAVQVDASGWHAEFRIPFSSLLFRPDEEGRVVMGLSLLRSIPRKNERIIFPAIPPRWGNWSHARSSEMQKVVLEGVEAVRGADLTPYLLGGGGSRTLPEGAGAGGAPARTRVQEVGLDVGVDATSNVRVDLTLNPDFAQVEADDQEVNLGRFSLFFPEKRRFFQERASTFEVPLGDEQERVFHSRRIGLRNGEAVPIHGGVRMVGREAGWDFGALSMRSEGTVAGMAEHQSVFRVRRQLLNANSYLGGIATHRGGSGGEANTVIGADGVLRIGGEEYLRFAAVGSRGAGEGDPTFLRVSWERPVEDGLQYRVGISRVGDAFRPEMGFLRRTDRGRADGSVGYGWRFPAAAPLRTASLRAVGSGVRRGAEGSVESAELEVTGALTTRGAHQWRITVPIRFEDLAEPLRLPVGATVPAGDHAFRSVQLAYTPPQGALLRSSVVVEAGGLYNAERHSLAVRPTLSLSRHFALSGSYAVDRLRFPGAEDAVVVHVARLRSEAWISARTSALAFIQYNSTLRLAVLNLRFRHTPREGQDLYLVWNHSFAPGVTGGPAGGDPALRERTFLIKYSHPLRIGAAAPASASPDPSLAA